MQIVHVLSRNKTSNSSLLLVSVKYVQCIESDSFIQVLLSIMLLFIVYLLSQLLEFIEPYLGSL